MIEELSNYTSADLRAIDALMQELSPTGSCSASIMENLAADPNAHLFVCRDDKGLIEACACLCVAHTTERCLGFVEAVVVSSSSRGKGYGRQIMEHLVSRARDFGVQSLHLTSRPSRTAANALYQSLGFQLHDTNCYHLDL